MERVTREVESASNEEGANNDEEKLTSSKLAKKLGLTTQEFLGRLVDAGYLELKEDKHFLAPAGKAAGGEFKMSKRFGPYFIWPVSLSVSSS